jgi:hypothetical protein
LSVTPFEKNPIARKYIMTIKSFIRLGPGQLFKLVLDVRGLNLSHGQAVHWTEADNSQQGTLTEGEDS